MILYMIYNILCELDLCSFVMQCASVSRVARMGHRKFKVADEKSSNKLFDEAYRHSALN
jgi:hypothetical protein